PLERFNQSASPGVGRLVARALAKAPGDRYPDAGALLRDLERLARGEPTDIAVHPRLPACDPARTYRFELRWDSGRRRDSYGRMSPTRTGSTGRSGSRRCRSRLDSSRAVVSRPSIRAARP